MELFAYIDYSKVRLRKYTFFNLQYGYTWDDFDAHKFKQIYNNLIS
jgi:hypothetical protein